MGSTKQLLHDLNEANGNALQFDESQIEKELAKDAVAYKGTGIKMLSIAGGLLGSLFFLGFVFIGVNESKTGIVILGAAAIIAAIVIERMADNTILDAACIGAYIAGLILIGYGINGLVQHHGDNSITLVLLAIAILTILFTPGFMLNFLAVLLISGCIFALININKAEFLYQLLTGILAAVYTGISMNEPRMLAAGSGINKRYSPFLNGTLFSLISLLLYHALDYPFKHVEQNWTSSVLIIGVLFFVIHQVVRHLDLQNVKTRVLLYAMSLLIVLPAIFAPAICGALLILVVSFHTSHRTGLIAGIMALIYFVGQYYYNLHYTLLEKSVMMFATGILFLVAWFVLKKQLKKYEQI